MTTNLISTLAANHFSGVLRAASRAFAFAVACSLVAIPAVAAGTNDLGAGDGWVIRAWGTAAGLPQNTVNAIAQTHDGYLWLGTREGLARFDGVRFTVFGLGEGLQSIEVQTLLEDQHGTLWIGTSGGGLSRLVDGRIENVPLSQALASGEVVSSLAEDAEGRLWVGTRAGLSLYYNGRFAASPAVSTLERAAIPAIACGLGGGMWIATATEGLLEFRGRQLTESSGPPGNERIAAYCLLHDREDNLWASVGNGSVLCRRSGEWTRYTQTNGLPFAYVTCMAQGADGTIWAGSLDDGLYRFQDGRFSPLRVEDGLSANDIRSLCTDREGNLWVGTRTGGLNRLSRRKLLSFGAAQGLTNDFTRAVAETADGVLHVGTHGGGLNQGGAGGFRPAPEELPGLRYAFVDSVLAVPDGSLWYGARRGLFRSKDGKVLNCFTNEPWLGPAAVTALCDDRQGGIWAGTSESRLVHFKDGRFTEFPQRMARGPITALAQQKDGFLWVGSEAGGIKGAPMNGGPVISLTNGILSHAIRTLHLDGDGTLWIGTKGGGLSRWRGGQMHTFTTHQGLGADTVSQIVESDDGDLWLGCSRGILRLRKSDFDDLISGKITLLNPRSFGLNEGMPVEECSSGFCPAGLKTKSGQLCFSTVKGLVFLDPRRLEADAPPPAALLEDVRINGQVIRMPASKPDTALDDAPAGTVVPEMNIPPGGRDVEFDYTAINFAAPEKIRFRYRLEGLDAKWIEAGGRRTAYYHALPVGDYVFQVMSASASSPWSQPVSLVRITVQPLLWNTPWFQVFAGFVLIAGLTAAVRVVERRRYRRRLARLEMQHVIERERVRISQDMHDQVGGILTQVSQLSDLGLGETGGSGATKAQFERIGVQARAAVQALDEIVWATNPKNDNLPRFAEYVSRFADEYFEMTSIRCWQEVPTQLPNLPIRADMRHNVFLAVKEALNNILKHSGATEVSLRLVVETGRVVFEIKDNGRGFQPTHVPTGGNGLSNMKSRLAECGGETELQTAPGQGTTIKFLLPLPAEPRG